VKPSGWNSKKEIEDWNCCGASVSYAGANDLAIKVLNARNLAIAEAEANYDIVAPCSSCYIQMIKVNHEIQEDPELLKEVNECLAEGELELQREHQCQAHPGCAL